MPHTEFGCQVLESRLRGTPPLACGNSASLKPKPPDREAQDNREPLISGLNRAYSAIFEIPGDKTRYFRISSPLLLFVLAYHPAHQSRRTSDYGASVIKETLELLTSVQYRDQQVRLGTVQWAA